MTTTPDKVPEEVTTRTDGESESTDSEGSTTSTGGEPALAVRGLSKTFGSGDEAVRAVDDVSFAVESGTVVGVLGPNGAGKTTTIKSILGLVVPTAGEVRVAGVDVAANHREAYSHVGAMLEGARNVYWKLTVRENLAFFAAVGGESPDALRDRHDQLLDQLNLAGKADEPVNDLSQGQKQKVSLACALARDVDVAFLDEPTLGLDVESSVELRAEIRRLADQEEMTIVLSSHDMDVVEDVCDRVIIMNDGEIIADDDVADLVDVFSTHAYEITVESALPASVRDGLRERYDAGEFDDRGERERFEVTLHDPERLYDLMDDLQGADCVVHDVASVDPDLEEVFLELTNTDPGRKSTSTGVTASGTEASSKGASRKGASSREPSSTGGERR